MINTRLEINGKSYAVVTDIPVSANYRIADIREPDKRNASFTKTISIYANSEINKLFENIFEVNIDLQTFNPNLKSDAVYFVDELENFKGDLQLLKIVKKPDNNIIYECNIIGQGGSLFLDIGDKLITGNSDSADDLDFSAYNHTYTRTNQIASYSNRGSSYIYPFIHKGSNNGGDNTFSVKDFLPCFFVKEYLQKIIAKTGRTLTSSFIDSAEFENHIIYPNIDTIELSQTQLENSQFYAGLTANVTAIQNSNSEQIIFNKETAPFFDVGNQNNTTSGIVTLNDNGKYNFACVLKLRVQVTHTDPTVTYAISSLNTIQPRVIINRSTDGGATYTSVAVTQNNWNNNPANTFNVSTWYNDTIACATGDMYFYSGDKFKADYYIQSGNIKYYNASNVEVTTGTGTVTIEIVSGNTGSAFYALRSDKQVAEGNAMAVNNALPKNIKQKDLFKSIIQMFHLSVDIDKNDANNLIIEPFDDFHIGVENWENKTDLDKDRTTTPIALIEGKKYIYRYKEDGDFYNKRYRDKWLEPFGTQNVTIENDFLKQDKVNEIIFSPTPNVANYDLGIIHPKIYKKEAGVISTFTPNIRILTVGGTFQADNAWTYQQAGLSDITTYDYLYAGHTDNPLNPTYDLNFGLPKEVYYTFIGAYFTDNNLFNRFHKNYLNNIINKNSKIETKYLWLSPKDIYEFDFRKKYFIDGAYYIVNQIIDYNPMRQDSTQVELVKLLEPEPFTPTSYLISSVPSVSSGVDVDVETPNSSLRLGTNTINQGENCIAVGDNIIIPKGCRNVTVIGNDIVIEEGTSNVTYLNGQLISSFSQGAQKEINADYTATLEDDIIYIDATGGVTLTLPDVVDCYVNGISKEYTVVRIDTDYSDPNFCRINTNDSALIVGDFSVYLSTKYDSITLFNNGIEWFIK